MAPTTIPARNTDVPACKNISPVPVLRAVPLSDDTQLFDLERRISERLAAIKEEIFLSGGKELIYLDALSKLLGIPKTTLSIKTNAKEEYTHVFLDGTSVTLSIGKGFRNSKTFLLDESTNLLRKILEKEHEIITISDMAKDFSICPGAIKNWFKKEGGTFRFSIDGEEQCIVLNVGIEAGGTREVYYLLRPQFEILKKFVEATYQKERTWQGIKTFVVPEGYLDVSAVAKLVGKSSDCILGKINYGKIPAVKSEEGFYLIKKEDAFAFKAEVESAVIPEGCIRISEMLELTGMEYMFFEKRKKTKDGKKFLRLKDARNELSWFELFYDTEGHVWMRKEDAPKIKKVLESKNDTLTKEQVADLLGLYTVTMWQNTFPETNTFVFRLPDGSVIHLRYAILNKESRFQKAEVEAAKKAKEECEKRMVYLPEMENKLGIGRAQILRVFSGNESNLSFVINGSSHTVFLRKNHRISDPSFMYSEEFEIYKKYHDIISLKSHLYVGSRLFDSEAKKNTILIENNHLIIDEGKGFRVSFPLDTVDGAEYVRRQHAELINFYFDIQSRYLHVRIDALLQFINGGLKEDETTKLKLLMIRDALKRESNLDLYKCMCRMVKASFAVRLMAMEIKGEVSVSENTSLDRAMQGYPDLLKIVYQKSERSVLPIFLAKEYNVVLPYEKADGKISISSEAIPLLGLYLDLFYSNDSLHASRAANLFLMKFDLESPIFIPGVWMIRGFANRHVNDINWFEALNPEKIKDHSKRELSILLKKLEEKRFSRIYGLGFDTLKSPYFSRDGIGISEDTTQAIPSSFAQRVVEYLKKENVV